MQKDLLLVVLITCLVLSVSYNILRDCSYETSQSVELLIQRNLSLEQELQKSKALAKANARENETLKNKLNELQATLQTTQTAMQSTQATQEEKERPKKSSKRKRRK